MTLLQQKITLCYCQVEVKVQVSHASFPELRRRVGGGGERGAPHYFCLELGFLGFCYASGFVTLTMVKCLGFHFASFDIIPPS